MTLKQFRELTKDMSDDTRIIINHHPCDTCTNNWCEDCVFRDDHNIASASIEKVSTTSDTIKILVY